MRLDFSLAAKLVPTSLILILYLDGLNAQGGLVYVCYSVAPPPAPAMVCIPPPPWTCGGRG